MDIFIIRLFSEDEGRDRGPRTPRTKTKDKAQRTESISHSLLIENNNKFDSFIHLNIDRFSALDLSRRSSSDNLHQWLANIHQVQIVLHLMLGVK